jgi:uncharacterized protein (TIGR03437 family)
MFRSFVLFLGIFSCAGLCQQPVIFPGGVVNAASYAIAYQTSPLGGFGLAGGSLASIFGTNLASTTMAAQGTPLPTKLGGTSVMVWGIPAHLLYVSPNQIDLQLPSYGIAEATQGVVVSTAAGSSPLFPVGGPRTFGIFTDDASGCGQGAVLNVSSSGATSVNSNSNSVSPGDFISVYGTGLGGVSPSPPDGYPAPSSPPLATTAEPNGGGFLDLDNNVGYSWAGRAPGLVGVDQINMQVPDTLREGCAVPLQFASDSMSQPVTIAIRSGGGQCVDPPSAGYGQIVWEKTMTTTPNASGGGNSTTESDTVTVSLQASPGKRPPVPPSYTPGLEPFMATYFTPACPVPGYRSLDAGAVSVQAPGLASTQATSVPLSGPIKGATMYQAALPNGTIQPGSFTVSAAGGADVAAFQSTVQLGAGIQITTPIAGQPFYFQSQYTIAWTGGDPNSLVTVYFINHLGYADYSYSAQGPVSAGSILVVPAGFTADDAEIVIEVTPGPSEVQALSASGLSLGGQHIWKYTYRFEGVTH